MSKLVRHDQTCFSCGEDCIVLQKPESESELNHCPFCGSTSVGAYGTEPPATEDDES